MERMSSLDAAFLQAEDEEPGVSMAIASIAVFDGPVPSYADFAGLLTDRLPLLPRYRQKARQVPLDLGRPVWVDDEHFDLSWHLRRTALPPPGGEAELTALMGRVMSARLDRRRPLWEYWLVEGLAGGRWALISKLHHCMVDGVSGTDLYTVVLDPTPQPRPAPPDGWRPAPEPSGLRLAAQAVPALALAPLGQLRALATAARHPARLPRTAAQLARGVAALTAAAVPAPASSLSGPLSGARRFAVARGSVADVRTIRTALGGTFNDVLLAAVAGAYRTLLLSRGEEPASGSVRTLVPVSTRAPGQESERGNRVSLLLAELPVDVADPVQRLAAVREEITRLRARHEAEAGAAAVALADLEPFPLVAGPLRLAAHVPQRSVVTVTTDVPGPREPLYALGRRLVEIIPYVPIASRLRIGVAIFTYCGQVTVGVTGDYDGAADIGVLAGGVEDGLRELLAAAAPPAPRRSRRAPSAGPPRPRGGRPGRDGSARGRR